MHHTILEPEAEIWVPAQ